jgi:predicted RNA-binding protein with PUA domain
MKTIVICGSMKLRERMLEVEGDLKQRGFDVLMPNMGEFNDYSTMTQEQQFKTKHPMIMDHLEKIKKGDAILVLNERLKDIDGYIGANSFLEMGFALCLNKKIFLLNKIPDQPNSVEIGGMMPTIRPLSKVPSTL